MKRFILIAISCISILCSCKKEILPTEDACCVPILLKGDYVETSIEPLGKGNDLKTYYGFQIDSLHIYEAIGLAPGDTIYHHVAEGVFTDITDLQVYLEKGHKYQITCMVIKEREERLYTENGYIFSPFTKEKATVANRFIYGLQRELYLSNREAGTQGLRTTKDTWTSNPKVDRYLGKYITETIIDNSPIPIHLTRYNYGLQMIITPPKSGTLSVKSDVFSYTLSPTSPSVNEESVYALMGMDKSKTMGIDIKLTKNDDSIIDLSLDPRVFNNKTMTRLKIDVNNWLLSSSSGFNISFDDSEMTYDEIEVN